MPTTLADRVLGEVSNLLTEHALAEWPDSRLLERFARGRDQAAFAALLERLRCVLVLCHLEGKTHAQAAAALGCPVGSVSRHLRRACARLRERLAARGVAAAAALPGVAHAAVPAALARATLQAVGQHV